MAVRLTQAQRKERTQSELVTTARKVFEERGFHAASLDEIAERAGYSKGAVYSNFAGKDDLFVAVLDEHLLRRARVYADVVLDQPTLDDSYRAVARFMVEAERRDPAWAALQLEFWAHASRRDELRDAVADRRERHLHAVAGLIDELAARHGIAFRVPSLEVARGSAALQRGM